jgi:predicted neuraminidase
MKIVFALIAGLMVLSYLLKPLPPLSELSTVLPEAKTSSSDAIFIKTTLPAPPTRSVHAFDVQNHGQDLIAVWYGGTKEAKPDVSLYLSHYDHQTDQWSQPRVIMSSPQLTSATGRMTILIGNATMTKRDNKLALFFVSVGAGGWAASSLNVMLSDDLGQTWSQPKRLITSPFLNISTLVRNPPIWVKDDLIAIPAYHESLNEFSEILWLNAEGTVVNKTRVLTGYHAIQPVIFANDDQVSVLHRSMDLNLPRVISRSAFDSKISWQDPIIETLPNSDSAMAGLTLEENLWLLAYNHTEKGRDRIDLSIKLNHQAWSPPINIEHQADHTFGYPAMTRTDDGLIHLFYTVDREYFRHVRFNQAWLEAQK